MKTYFDQDIFQVSLVVLYSIFDRTSCQSDVHIIKHLAHGIIWIKESMPSIIYSWWLTFSIPLALVKSEVTSLRKQKAKFDMFDSTCHGYQNIGIIINNLNSEKNVNWMEFTGHFLMNTLKTASRHNLPLTMIQNISQWYRIQW